MSSANHPPEKHGASARDCQAQVVVRADKYFLCSSCGTLVEIPAEVVGQLVLANHPSLPSEPAAGASDCQEATPREPSQAQPVPSPAVQLPKQTNSVAVQASPSSTRPRRDRPPRPKRPQPPRRESLLGQTIDGLTVPSGEQLDRALAWVSFHLRVLDRQNSEITRLTKLLKERPTTEIPCSSILGNEKEDTQQASDVCGGDPLLKQAQADLGVAPDVDQENERGPP
ncbi:hypothetical protein [Bremerella sp.]|uniref:hypothetical protein n=1 Tax=Bremerella sp. TaxID=2795602 RepID=UPI00391AAEB2